MFNLIDKPCFVAREKIVNCLLLFQSLAHLCDTRSPAINCESVLLFKQKWFAYHFIMAEKVLPTRQSLLRLWRRTASVTRLIRFSHLPRCMHRAHSALSATTLNTWALCMDSKIGATFPSSNSLSFSFVILLEKFVYTWRAPLDCYEVLCVTMLL